MIITIIIVINIKNFSLSDRVSWTLHASNERLMRQACQAAHLLDTSDLCTEIRDLSGPSHVHPADKGVNRFRWRSRFIIAKVREMLTSD